MSRRRDALQQCRPGAWYAAAALTTSVAEVAHHMRREAVARGIEAATQVPPIHCGARRLLLDLRASRWHGRMSMIQPATPSRRLLARQPGHLGVLESSTTVCVTVADSVWLPTVRATSPRWPKAITSKSLCKPQRGGSTSTSSAVTRSPQFLHVVGSIRGRPHRNRAYASEDAQMWRSGRPAGRLATWLRPRVRGRRSDEHPANKGAAGRGLPKRRRKRARDPVAPPIHAMRVARRAFPIIADVDTSNGAATNRADSKPPRRRCVSLTARRTHSKAATAAGA